ncbi:MAG: hypothetical protein WCG01_01395 [bacterium]
MKKALFLAPMLVVFFAISALAGGMDYHALGKQFEANGTYGSAFTNYELAVHQTSSLARRAEIYVDCVRVFLKSNNFNGATEQMREARRNDPKRVVQLLSQYEPLARKVLIKTLNDSRNPGTMGKRERSENFAYFQQFFPKSAWPLADDLYNLGVKEHGTAGEEYWFDFAADAHPKMAAKIANYYLGSNQNLPIEQQVGALTKAGRHLDDTTRSKKAQELLVIGKELAKKPGEEARTSAIRSALVALMGQEWVNMKDNLPETVSFSKGEYEESVKAGEQTPYWITVNELSEVRYLADNKKFKVVYDDGTESRLWVQSDIDRVNASDYKSSKFRMIGVENCGITMVVK